MSTISQPLIGLGKKSQTVTTEYPVIAMSAETYDFLCKQRSNCIDGRYIAAHGFIIRVAEAANVRPYSMYECETQPVTHVLYLQKEFRGARVVCKFEGHAKLLEDLPLLREALADVAKRMRQEQANLGVGIFAGTVLL